MKRIVLMIGLAMAASAWGQGQKPAAAEAAKPAAPQAAKEPAKRAARATHKSRRQEDARHCLDEPSNGAIIKCAEEYL
jgi:hypothetical protein